LSEDLDFLHTKVKDRRAADYLTVQMVQKIQEPSASYEGLGYSYPNGEVGRRV
jgi:hypothetical protein